MEMDLCPALHSSGCSQSSPSMHLSKDWKLPLPLTTPVLVLFSKPSGCCLNLTTRFWPWFCFSFFTVTGALTGVNSAWQIARNLTRGLAYLLYVNRHVRGSRKRIQRSDPKDLDPRSVRIIDPTFTVCRQIHWDHRSAFAIRQEIHSDPRSETPYCVGIHGDPISDKRNSHIFGLFFKRLTFFIEV